MRVRVHSNRWQDYAVAWGEALFNIALFGGMAVLSARMLWGGGYHIFAVWMVLYALYFILTMDIQK